VLSIDLVLQKLVEDMFGDRRGALVAIDPRTGEILAFVSKPTFDPNLFTDGVDPQVWQGYNESPDKPLLNRPLRGTYPPGSTYKPFMALAALESGKRTPNTTIFDPGYFQFGGHKFRDSNPRGNGAVDLHRSIVVSSDTYYYMVANDMGVDAIHDFMKPWGFGQLTGIDLEGEVPGILPSSAWKLRRYKQKWLAGETISIGIGQGYNAFTILQLAHATATLAADGVVRPPRVVRALENPSTRGLTPVSTPERERIALKPEWLKLVKSAMVDVNRFGTGRHAFVGAPYAAAGKTGTAQVIGIKQNERYDARRIAERYRDHSLFMAFAPADNPQIALAVIVENAGFGAAAAAPIARRAIDYVLLGLRPEGDPVKAVTIGIASEDPTLRDVPDGPQPEPDPVPAPNAPAIPTPGLAPVRPSEQERP
jgi:penicillin-binding protein 2